jgi:hypothetical protein
LKLPVDVLVHNPKQEEEPTDEYVYALQQRLNDVHTKPRQMLKRAACHQKITYDKKDVSQTIPRWTTGVGV